LGEASVGSGVEPTIDLNSSWAPSGTAIYFERTFRGARNLWKMTIDPNTLRATTIERLTTGPGYDTGFAVSPDGRKLAYTGATRHFRVWLFPFDATRGHVTGVGQPVTSTGMEAWQGDLSRDGKKFAFSNLRGGKWAVWEKSLPDGQESPVLADEYKRENPRWSPDGTRLAYMRHDKSSPANTQIMIWSSQNRHEEALTALSTENPLPYDWSADGKRLLVSLGNSDSHRQEIWVMPVIVPGSPRGSESRKITSHPAYDLYQPHYSPDGRWVVFEAFRASPKIESTLYVIPAMGGAWIPVTDGRNWDDKPRWSPDGKTIYFVSSRRGVYNVWGIRFDSTNGKPVGDAFPVTAFGSPGLVMPDVIPLEELSLTQDKLVLTMEDRSGGIWVLDNVDR
jgi:Tol biopolymer transport system component